MAKGRQATLKRMAKECARTGHALFPGKRFGVVFDHSNSVITLFITHPPEAKLSLRNSELDRVRRWLSEQDIQELAFYECMVRPRGSEQPHAYACALILDAEQGRMYEVAAFMELAG